MVFKYVLLHCSFFVYPRVLVSLGAIEVDFELFVMVMSDRLVIYHSIVFYYCMAPF